MLDEVHRAPELLSHLQGVVDERQRMGELVVTGSRHRNFGKPLVKRPKPYFLEPGPAIGHLLPARQPRH